ncbi:MAG: nitrilase-related carbon-nitrogen hydrolase [Microthrixaceae bacterium]
MSGYREDHYFEPGDTGFPVWPIGNTKVGLPTCWDQWNPELARIYSLSGAEILVYPTAIGSEPHLDQFDTQPMWQQIIAANGLANATFMVVVNRIGHEGTAAISTDPRSFLIRMVGVLVQSAAEEIDQRFWSRTSDLNRRSVTGSRSGCSTPVDRTNASAFSSPVVGSAE